MKRRELIRHLEENGCRELREGSRHTMYVNPRQKKVAAVPRHTEINEILARKSAGTWKSPSRVDSRPLLPEPPSRSAPRAGKGVKAFPGIVVG